MESLIELQTVTVQAEEHVSLDTVSVVFPVNRSTVIMGPSGSGKSMLLKVAAAIIPPDSGRVLLWGKNLQRLSQKEMIEFRLRHAGYNSPVPLFTDEAIRLIYMHSQGYPRRIAAICHDALETLIMKDQKVVDVGVVSDIIQQEVR